MTNLAIAANRLRKSYRDKVVLDGIDLAVPEATIFSLLGPNDVATGVLGRNGSHGKWEPWGKPGDLPILEEGTGAILPRAAPRSARAGPPRSPRG
jgi:hypothetical protein